MCARVPGSPELALITPPVNFGSGSRGTLQATLHLRVGVSVLEACGILRKPEERAPVESAEEKLKLVFDQLFLCSQY